MSKLVYGWRRFWFPRAGSINLAGSSYLNALDAEGGEACSPGLVTLEEIADVPCLVLLGEPGIGKSQEMKKLRSFTEESVGEGDQILLLDLDDCSEDKLHTNLFKSEIFTDWINGTHWLYLFLDSFDQGWLTIPKLPTLLVEEFKELNNISEANKTLKKNNFNLICLLTALQTGFLQVPVLNRLHIRIACRTSIFSQAESSFSELWGSRLRSYDLNPLCPSDIKIALNAHNLDADACLNEIVHKGLISLAIKPIPLKFLIKKLQRNNGQLPDNQTIADIYLDGCRELCREPKDETRHPLKRVSNLEIDQRLMIAARIAAINVLCRRATVWIGQSLGDDNPNKDILVRELLGQCKNTNSEGGLQITESAIKEALDTALFTSRELNRMGWAHRTYAEFLAAHYLVQHEISLAQITELIFSLEDPEHKLTPQLQETAVWLASMRMDILKKIIKTDPDVLLQSDVPIDANFKELILNNLLAQYEEGKLSDRYGNNYRNYAKLKHPGLTNQLRPYICDPSNQVDARYLAIDITKVCEISELQEELVNLALCSCQSVSLRVNAANALCSIGDAGTRLKLKHLAIDQLPEDEDDRLKGYALQALWSTHPAVEEFSVEELFQALTPPKKRNFFGGYQMFLDYQMVPHLQPDGLVLALNWLGTQGVRCFGHPFEQLGDAILFKAWENFDLPEVVASFIKVALVQWREHQRIISHDSKLQEQFASSLSDDNKKRHTLIEQAILTISDTEEDPYFLLSSLTEIILASEDIFWILERLRNPNSERIQRIWAQLLQWSFNRQDAKQIDAIIVATKTNNILQEYFTPYFVPIELDSAQANELRADYLRLQEIQERKRNSSLLDPPPKERVLQSLEKLEAEDLSSWWQLNMEMSLKPESKYYDNELELNLTKLPGWEEADETTQKRIIEGAKKYIQQQDDIDYEWIGTNTFDRPSLAGCRAFQLLLQQNLDFLEHLSSELWKKWAPIIIAAPASNQHEDSYLELVKLAYMNAPEESLNTLTRLIDKENQEHENLFLLNRLDKCWDERLKLALLEKAKNPTLKPKCVGELLEELLKRGLTEAGDFAKSLISFPLPAGRDEHEKALIAARVLVENSEQSSWSFIWSLIQQDSSFGREVLELAVNRYPHGIQLNLTETQLADLYIWLVHQYPHTEDPDYSHEVMAHIVTIRESMANLRDNFLTQLKEKGTRQACAEIQRLIQEFPDLTWLRRTLIDAQASMRRKTWQPPPPESILQLVARQNPSHLELYNQLEQIDRRTQAMADEPRITNKIDASNSHIYAPIGTSGTTNSQVTVSSPDSKKGINWGNLLAIVGILVGIIAIPASMSVSGAFNEEFKLWFNSHFPLKLEQQPVPRSR